MPYADTDLAFGRQVVRLIVDFKSNPPLVRREYQSVLRLHAELRLLGMHLVARQHKGLGGFHLFYTRGDVLVRIKTRGSGKNAPFRGGVPHLSVVLLSGKRTAVGEKDLSKHAEEGMFHVGGALY